MCFCLPPPQPTLPSPLSPFQDSLQTFNNKRNSWKTQKDLRTHFSVTFHTKVTKHLMERVYFGSQVSAILTVGWLWPWCKKGKKVAHLVWAGDRTQAKSQAVCASHHPLLLILFLQPSFASHTLHSLQNRIRVGDQPLKTKTCGWYLTPFCLTLARG